jgi:biotin synthase
LIPREGTPKELDNCSIDPMDIIRTIAVWRFIMPKTILKIAGGREVHLMTVENLLFRLARMELLQVVTLLQMETNQIRIFK